MGKEDVLRLLARWFPQPDVAPSVCKMPSRVTGTSATDCDIGTAPVPSVPLGLGGSTPASPCPPPLAPSNPPLVRPLAPERYEVRFTADAETRALLKEAQDLLGHVLPTGDIATVFHRALKMLVADLKRRKFGATARPRPARTSSGTPANIPAAVRREVATRDANRCAFVSKNGHRCGETRFLEFHHVVPRAAGGEATPDNIQLRCRAHNGYEVDLFFGPGKRWTKKRARGRPSDTRPGTGDAPHFSSG
jgi:5-methylcytosine-specific restriction endonuclease McrA